MKTYQSRKEKEESNLKGKTPEELTEYFDSIGEPSYRALQAFRRINKHFAQSISEFSEFSKDLRSKLEEFDSFPTLEIIDSQLSRDGTEKLVLARSIPKAKVRINSDDESDQASNETTDGTANHANEESAKTSEEYSEETTAGSADHTDEEIARIKEREERSIDPASRVLFEVVWLVSGTRRTICISSQSGCTLNCEFCATGSLPFKGNLSAWEILDQVYMLIARKKEMPTNIVFMGMGEPMYNYDNVMKAASILNHPDGLHLSARHITISTAGVIPGIERMIKEKRTFNLAVSLNHPNPAKRGEIMDVEKRFPLPSLLKTLRTFSNHASRSVTFEYVMIPGINISKKDAEDLIKIARPLKAKINLIPYNSESKKWRAPTDDEIVDFQEILLNADLFVFNRGSAGKDINGACGMLACKRSGKA